MSSITLSISEEKLENNQFVFTHETPLGPEMYTIGSCTLKNKEGSVLRKTGFKTSGVVSEKYGQYLCFKVMLETEEVQKVFDRSERDKLMEYLLFRTDVEYQPLSASEVDK